MSPVTPERKKHPSMIRKIQDSEREIEGVTFRIEIAGIMFSPCF